MSGIPADLDLREQIARIDRSIAETEKLIAEQRKLSAEERQLSFDAVKLAAEQATLYSEAHKLDRDRWLAPTLAIVSVVGGLLGVASFIARLIHQ